MTGVTLAISLVAAAELWNQESTIAALFCIFLVAALAYVFYGDFLSQGNLPAHLYGFTSGVLLTAAYFAWNSSHPTRNPRERLSGRDTRKPS